MDENKKQTKQFNEWIRREDSADVYSNMYHLNWSIVDVRIRFGQMVPTETTASGRVSYVIEENAAVTVSWPQAKALRDSLIEAVSRYENTNGEIILPNLKLPE
jgi:uncharacterized protein with NRDE domain